MYKYVIGIDGMRCGMCEVHVQDVIRKNFRYKKVKANRFTKTVTVFSIDDISNEEFIHAFSTTGYRVLNYNKTDAVKKLFGWR